MNKKIYADTAWMYIKQTLAYFLVFGFVVSMLTVANICFMPAEVEAHAGTCPYTGPATLGEGTGGDTFTCSYPAGTGKTAIDYVSKEKAETLSVGQTYKTSYSYRYPYITMPSTTKTCPICGASVTTYSEEDISAYYKVTSTVEEYSVNSPRYGYPTYYYTLKVTAIEPLSKYLTADTSTNMPAHDYPATHTCGLSCRQVLHTHVPTSYDYTYQTYNCDGSVYNTREETETYAKGALVACSHAGKCVTIYYYCQKCGEEIKLYSEDGCTTSSCKNYYKKAENCSTRYYGGATEDNPAHTYSYRSGEQRLCTKTSFLDSYETYTSTNDYTYHKRCKYCGEWIFEYRYLNESDYDITSEFTAAQHWYHVDTPLPGSCYTLENIHSPSVTGNKVHTGYYYCDGHTSTKESKEYRTDYTCSVCNQIVYDYYEKGCTGTNSSCEREKYYTERLSNELRIGTILYDKKNGDEALNSYFYHWTKTLTCTKATHGDYICDQVVTKLTPLNTKQTIQAGGSIDTRAYAKFLNGSISIVNCSVSGYSPTKYNTWQTVTLSYGNFTSVSKEGSRTVTIQVYVERTDFDLTAKIESGIDGSVTGTGKYTAGTSVTVGATTVPATGGYTFDGWHDGTGIVSKNLKYTFAMPTKNLTLTAMFTPITYKLNVKSEYTSMGTVFSSLTSDVCNGTTYTKKQIDSEIVKEECSCGTTTMYDKIYEFTCSTCNSVVLEGFFYGCTRSSCDKSINNQIEDYIDKNWPSRHTTTPAYAAPYASSVTVHAEPKTGFTFEGWYNGTERVSTSATYTFIMPANNVSLLARFTAGQYTVSFDSDGGSTCSSIKVSYLGTYGSLPTPTKNGYVFAGWKYGTTKISETSPVTYKGNHTLKATWEKKVPDFILVTYGHKYGDNSWSNDTANIGYLGLTADTLGRALPVPYKIGYSFAGWFSEEDETTNFVEDVEDSTYKVTASTLMDMTEEHTLHAGWVEKQYTLSFDANGGTSCSDMKVSYDRRYGYHNSLPTPTKAGYSFAGWYAAEADDNGIGTEITDTTRMMTDGNHKLYAKWSWDAVNVTVTFEPNPNDGASTIGSITSGTGQRLVTYPGTYGGHTITACYCKESSHSSLKDFGGKHYVIDLSSASTALPTATRAGYTFKNWVYAGNTVTKTTEIPVSFSHTVFAAYTPNTYKVTLDGQGATKQTQTSVTMTFDTKGPNVTVPEKTGYAFKGYYSGKEGSGTEYYNENGTGTDVWDSPDISVKTLYAYWETSSCKIIFDGRGATSTNHTLSKEADYDEMVPDIVAPSKTGYTFMGYYTGVRGSGDKYYDNTGKGIKKLETEQPDNKLTLYACWQQNTVTPPTADDYITPTPLPDNTITGNVGRSDTKALLYADDYNPATGALTDLQPYLTYDTPGGEGVIPGTELLSFRAKMGAWMLSYRFKRHSGTDVVKIKVTVPYRTQYEKTSDESLVISEQKTATYTFEVPRTWSYWTVEESGLYYPKSVTIENEALAGGSITIPVTGVEESADVPDCETTHYSGKTNHVQWESTDASGNPLTEIELPEQYIISDVPGSAPDAEAYLKVVCKNAAWANTDKLKARSDAYTFNGIVILSGEWYADGHGDSPFTMGLPANAEFVSLTDYTQTYKSGIEMDETKANGYYATTAYVTYQGDAGNIGTPETKTVDLTDINGLRIHTPVACKGVAVDGLEEVKGEEDSYILTLKEALNFFTLRIDNTGTHRLSLGYGTKDFAYALSGKSNVAEKNGSLQNRVKFPFDVYVDVGNNSLKPDGTYDTTGDFYLEADTWVSTYVEQRFYVPVTMKNGDYEIQFQSIATNYPWKENGLLPEEIIQRSVNKNPESYVATDYFLLEIKSFLIDFSYVGTDDPVAADFLLDGKESLVLKKGYNFSYCLQTQGEFYGDRVEFIMQPAFYWEKNTGAKWKEVKLYRLEEFLYGRQRICYPWKESILQEYENYEVIKQSFTGGGRIPSDILCVDVSFDLEEYCKWNTLSGDEEFLLQDGFLVIQFEIKVKSNSQCWYVWENIAATTIRYDLSACVSDDYEVGGVE